MLNGKSRELGLGPLRLVNLAEARNRARQARQSLLDKVDPVEIKHAALQARKIEQARTITFAEACERLLATDRIQKLGNNEHRRQWRSTLELACATLGKLPLQAIDPALVLKVLDPILKRTPETGSRLRGRIEAVFDWAIPLGYFTGENPARLKPLKRHLPSRPRAKHHPALRYMRDSDKRDLGRQVERDRSQRRRVDDTGAGLGPISRGARGCRRQRDGLAPRLVEKKRCGRRERATRLPMTPTTARSPSCTILSAPCQAWPCSCCSITARPRATIRLTS